MSLSERGHPVKNLKQLVKKLKAKFKCVLNKDKLRFEKIKNAYAMVFSAPAQKLTVEEIEILKQYVNQGGYLILLATDGGDRQ